MRKRFVVLGSSFGVLACAAALVAQSSGTVNWPLHNLDLAGGRFSPMDQINTANVATLTPRWLFQTGVIDGVSNQTTPVIVDGSMYVTDPRGSVYALDAADGHLLWTFDVTELIGGGAKAGYIFRNRGVCYADGVVYTAAGSFLFALDAKTGKPIQSFGKDGQASVILDVIKERYPDVTAAITLGYWFTTAPQIHNGVIYIGSTRSESHIPGGHVLAVDAKTGKVRWHFNTIPQDDTDQGWEIAGPTWVGGERNGGGIWETPSIDPELGTDLRRGRQSVRRQHEADRHQPVHRFDHRAVARHRHAEVALPAGAPRRLGLRLGQPADPVRHAGARAAREGARRGEQERLSLHPQSRDRAAGACDQGDAGADRDGAARRAAVADAADSVHGGGAADEAGRRRCFRSTCRPERLAVGKPVPIFTPPGPNQIYSPGTEGGANYGPLSYSPRTGLLYVNAVDSPLGARRPAKGYFSAFDPSTGELAWQQTFDGWGQAGIGRHRRRRRLRRHAAATRPAICSRSTPRPAQLLWKFNTGGGVFSSPAVYMVNGEEFVTVASGGGERGRRGGDLILASRCRK